MAVGQFRARSGTEIIDAAFQLVKANYAPLVTIAAIGSVPVLLAALIDPRNTMSMTGQVSTPAIVGIVLRLLYVLTVFLMQLALIRATSDAYLGRPIDIAGSFRVTGTTAARIMGVGIVAGFIIMIGTILLVIPGIIAFAWFFLAPAIVLLEGATVRTALERSRFLSQDKKLAIIGSMLVFFIAMIVLGVLSGLVMFFTHFSAVGAVTNAVLMVLVWPLYPALITVHYYDARIRKEGYDVELMAQAVSPTAGAPAASAI